MSYPGPPGVSRGQQPSSLPPRPPAPKLNSGFKPAFSAAPSYPAAPTHAGAPGSYSSAPTNYGAPPTTSSYNAYPQPSAVGPGRGYGQAPGAYSYPQQPAQQTTNYYGPTPPQIRNPFPVPSAGGQGGSDFDPEAAAQIAQWQSAYMPRDPSEQPAKGGRPGQAGQAPVTAAAATVAEPTDASANEKKKTVFREGGGKKWQDDTLLEWDPAHLRLFVGNLAGETTDESLLKAFSRWKSVQKAKVIRDTRTTKSKGYGFVSFSDPDDFFQSAKEMNGKYIQSHPVVVHKAKTEIRAQKVREDDRHRRGGKNQKKGKKSGNGMGSAEGSTGGYEPSLGPAHGGGVTKPGQKTRGGLKLLG
ncbi:RNA-binding domain-containing protein [Thozetella sp. PMI_491]|nr:RNA-binding domain-containing protein [Thozetella sp. PMI_491]